ncbi:hypothetical protein [Streptomyces sp. NPDC053367]|uniref:hypothetical protein n=1 Tax=Streptomyces sp. NPDC053367 TaxID=3365700 RepID=UPI0037D98F11
MGRLFNRAPEPRGYQPTQAEITDAANRLNTGSHHAAYELVAHSGDYQQQTAMRILAASIQDPDD